MSETTLLMAFIAFVFIVLIVGLFARKMSVRDIFDEGSVSLKESSPTRRDSFPSPMTVSSPTALSTSTTEKKNTGLDREKISKISKVLSIIGMLVLFLPTPESFKIVGIGMVFLGSIIGKATATKEKKAPVTVNPVAQKIRLLASKPEYQKALKILSEDYKKGALVSEEEKYRHALQYLQSTGVPLEEAKKNLKLLYTLLVQNKK